MHHGVGAAFCAFRSASHRVLLGCYWIYSFFRFWEVFDFFVVFTLGGPSWCKITIALSGFRINSFNYMNSSWDRRCKGRTPSLAGSLNHSTNSWRHLFFDSLHFKILKFFIIMSTSQQFLVKRRVQNEKVWFFLLRHIISIDKFKKISRGFGLGFYSFVQNIFGVRGHTLITLAQKGT